MKKLVWLFLSFLSVKCYNIGYKTNAVGILLSPYQRSLALDEKPSAEHGSSVPVFTNKSSFFGYDFSILTSTEGYR